MKLTHAGAVVFNKNDNNTLFLIISSSDGKNWVFPKGHIENGEKPEEASLRELKEEAGILGEVVSGLSIEHYIKQEEMVNIRYFLIKRIGEAKSKENRSIKWVDEKTALLLLSFEDAKNALRSAIKVMRII